jgi:hypothetical protein
LGPEAPGTGRPEAYPTTPSSSFGDCAPGTSPALNQNDGLPTASPRLVRCYREWQARSLREPGNHQVQPPGLVLHFINSLTNDKSEDRCARAVARTSSLPVSRGIVVGCDDFGVRWQSEAATPLFGGRPRQPKRRGAALPAALQNVWLRLRRAALYRGYPVDIQSAGAPGVRTACRLEVGDTADLKSALQLRQMRLWRYLSGILK